MRTATDLCLLMKAILKGRFAYEKYYSTKTYRGINVQTTPLFASYGQIGYVVNFPFESFNTTYMEYDWERKELTITDGMNRNVITK